MHVTHSCMQYNTTSGDTQLYSSLILHKLLPPHNKQQNDECKQINDKAEIFKTASDL